MFDNQSTHVGNETAVDIEQPVVAPSFTDEFKSFYAGDFKSILSTFFKNPIDGLRQIFEQKSKKAYTQALILFLSVFLLYMMGSYVAIGKARKYMDFSDFIKIGLVPVLFMLFVSLISFSMKSGSGKPAFRTELLTGALCGIPFGILFLLLLSVQMFGDDGILRLMRDPEDLGALASLIFIYIFLMLINVVQQSLKAAGSKDSTAWYGAPIAVLFSFYLTYQVFSEILS